MNNKEVQSTKPEVSAWVVYAHDGARKTQADMLRFSPSAKTSVRSFATPEDALTELQDARSVSPDIIFMQDAGALPFFSKAQLLSKTPIHEVIVTPHEDISPIQDVLLQQDPPKTETTVLFVLNPHGLQQEIQKVVNTKSQTQKLPAA